MYFITFIIIFFGGCPIRVVKNAFRLDYSNRFWKCQATTVASSKKMKTGLCENRVLLNPLFNHPVPHQKFKTPFGRYTLFSNRHKLTWRHPQVQSAGPMLTYPHNSCPACHWVQIAPGSKNQTQWIESLLLSHSGSRRPFDFMWTNMLVFFHARVVWIFFVVKNPGIGQTMSLFYFCSIGDWHRVPGAFTYISMQSYWMPLWTTSLSPLNTADTTPENHYGRAKM